MMWLMRLASLSVVLLLGCTRGLDPCPRGASLIGDRCVVDDERRASDAGAGGVLGSDAESEASTIDAETELDGSDVDAEPAPSPEAGTDLDAEGDAEPEPGPEDGDANSGNPEFDAGDASTTYCAPDDVRRWYDFHLSARMTTEIGSCARVTPGCSAGGCPMISCLLERLSMNGCEDCVADEAACVAAACAEQCGASTDNEACRACACSHDCVVAFEACHGAPLDVCSDCDETTCITKSFVPLAEIMTVVSLLLR
jgi:hypothetical protein